jgi:hypothetical protein
VAGVSTLGDVVTAEDTALALAEALQTDLVFRLDLLHQAGAPRLILAAVLLDLGLQLAKAEQGLAAEVTVENIVNNFFRPQIDLH